MSINKDFEIQGLEPAYKGKVRNIYNLENKLLIIASDRISAFDVVFNEVIPDKGSILSQISNIWFENIDFIPHHIIETNAKNFPEPFNQYAEQIQDRAVLVKKAKRIDFECVVRGYLMGSGYKEYLEPQEICGNKLPSGLKQGDKLPEPIFTPATKNDVGHDENVSFEYMKEKLNDDNLSNKLKELSIKLFNWGSEKLASKGIIIADTKFEFGILNDEIILIDEVMTPDSSRFWSKEAYDKAMAEGKQAPSLDKQIIRDYLNTLDWDKNPPPPKLPDDIIQKTRSQYMYIKDEIKCIF